MKKIVLFIILSTFLYWVSLWWFCDKTPPKIPPKPDVCNASPEWLENYLENAVYIINKIDTNKKTQWPSWLWSQAWQTPVWAVWVTTFFSVAWLWNFFQNFYVIFEDNHIVRDWVKLINFKQYITKYFLQASWNGILNKNIENLDEIKNKVKQTDSFILTGWNFKTYKETLKYIWNNQVLIEKIYFEEVVNWWIWNIKDIENNKNIKDIIASIKDNTKYTINKNKLQKLISNIRKTYYENWQKIECSSTWADFIKSIHNIVCNIWADKVSEAIDRFSCNYERLKYALNLGGSEWNCWSVKIKDWIPLKDRVKINWLTKAKANLKELWKVISDKISAKIHDWLSDLFQSQKTNTTYTSKHNVSNLELDTLKNKLESIDTKIKDDKDNVNSVITHIEPGTFTHNTTIMFPEISQKIYQIRKILWISNNDKDTILDNTATACENQSPFGGKCRP